MPRRTVPGIFCVEGDWKPDLTQKDSVLPLLQLLHDVAGAPYIRRDVATIEELAHLLRRWTEEQYRTFPIAYLAFHGSTGMLHVGGARLGLDELGEILAGSCEGRTIYFGSCGVLDIPGSRIEEFRDRTGAACVAGFDETVYWIETAAFDLIFFEAYCGIETPAEIDRWLRAEHGAFVRRLGFKMYY